MPCMDRERLERHKTRTEDRASPHPASQVDLSNMKVTPCPYGVVIMGDQRLDHAG